MAGVTSWGLFSMGTSAKKPAPGTQAGIGPTGRGDWISTLNKLEDICAMAGRLSRNGKCRGITAYR
jgi:hypothetical protein